MPRSKSFTMRSVYLIKVDAGVNNNKFYRITPKDDGTFLAEWGRVGGHTSSKVYPASRFQSTLNSKLRKGYEDHTQLEVVSSSTGITGKGSDLVTLLQQLSSDSFKSNYAIEAGAITQAKIDKVQALLDAMVGVPLDTFNDRLTQVFAVLPRKMRRVADHLAIDDESAKRILGDEQDNVDVLAGQIIQPKAGVTSVLDAYGLEIELLEDYQMLRTMMAGDGHRIQKVWKVHNQATQAIFDKHLETAVDKTTSLLFHGSRNQNWWSICNNGLKVRPTGVITTGSMFGDGIYFANKARKSIGYCSSRGSYWARGNSSFGLLAVYEVHTGNQKHIKRHSSSCYRLSRKTLDSQYDSVYAHGGIDLRNDEFIVYTTPQSTIKYLIQFGS